MKHYLQNELKLVNKNIKKYDVNSSEYLNSIKTKKHIMNLLENKESIKMDTSNKLSLDQYHDLIVGLINTYSKMKLLDTEFPLDYPMLKVRKISVEEIIEFIHSLYYEELPDYYAATFNLENIKLFNYSIIKRIIKDGNCQIYRKYYKNESIILINSYNNIKDFIIPASKSIETMPYLYYDENMKLKHDLMENYMKFRSTEKLKKTTYYKDANDYELIQRDSLIIAARAIKNMINIDEKFDILDEESYSIITSFMNTTLGLELSKRDDITLNELLSSTYTDILSYFENIKYDEVGLEDNYEIVKIKKLTKKTTM